MTWPKYIIVDKWGWPVTGFKGRPIVNFIRKVIHGRGIITRAEWLEKENRRVANNNSFGGATTTYIHKSNCGAYLPNGTRRKDSWSFQCTCK